MRYRELKPSEVDAAGRLLVETYPHRAHEIRYWPQSQETSRWAAFHDATSALVGYAALWHVQQQKYRFDVIVDRAWRGRSIGSELFGLVFYEAKRLGARTIQARAYDSCIQAMTFLGRREFVETMRMHGFVLDLSRVDDHSLSAWTRAVTGDDIAITPVSPSDIDDTQFWRGLSAMHSAAREGWPSPDPGGPADPVSESDLRRLLLPSSGNLPLAFFVARRRNELVAYSVLVSLREPDSEAQFAVTAVRPDSRSLGIATTLRARCLAVAKAAGCHTVRSCSGNPALLRINARFGFEQRYCEVRLVRQVQTN